VSCDRVVKLSLRFSSDEVVMLGGRSRRAEVEYVRERGFKWLKDGADEREV